MRAKSDEYSSSKLNLHLDRIARLEQGEDVFPITVEFNVTNRCNFMCEWCSEARYRSAYSRATLPWQIVVRAIRDMARCGVRSITLEGGGEPTLHPRFEDIVLADLYDVSLGLITNGSLLHKFSEEFFERLSYLRVSLDAGTPETYEKVHGAGVFNEVVANISMIANKRGKKPGLGVSFIVSENTMDDMVEAARLVKEAGADYIQFKPLLGKDLKIHYFDMGDRLERAQAVQDLGSGSDFRVTFLGSPRKRSGRLTGFGITRTAGLIG